MSNEFVNLTTDNIASEHLCCAIADKKHQRGEHHGAGGGDAVSGGQIGGAAKAQHHQQHNHQQHPIHGGNIDLADFGFAGVVNLHARGEAELDGLAGERISARNHRLAGDEGGRALAGSSRGRHEPGIDPCRASLRD